MLIGVPREIKDQEFRVGLTPASAREIVEHGHGVLVESGAGAGIGATDADYKAAGAQVAAGADEVFSRAEMVVKVKEPQAVERKRLRRGQVLLPTCTSRPIRNRRASSWRAARYVSPTRPSRRPTGGLPLLAPMSEVAGRMAVQAGAHCLEKTHGGWGSCWAAWPACLRRRS